MLGSLIMVAGFSFVAALRRRTREIVTEFVFRFYKQIVLFLVVLTLIPFIDWMLVVKFTLCYVVIPIVALIVMMSVIGFGYSKFVESKVGMNKN